MSLQPPRPKPASPMSVPIPKLTSISDLNLKDLDHSPCPDSSCKFPQISWGHCLESKCGCCNMENSITQTAQLHGGAVNKHCKYDYTIQLRKKTSKHKKKNIQSSKYNIWFRKKTPSQVSAQWLGLGCLCECITWQSPVTQNHLNELKIKCRSS